MDLGNSLESLRCEESTQKYSLVGSVSYMEVISVEDHRSKVSYLFPQLYWFTQSLDRTSLCPIESWCWQNKISMNRRFSGQIGQILILRMNNSSIEKFKYLEKSRYRFKKSSSTTNLHDTVGEKSVGESMFAVDTNRSTIIDIFNILDTKQKEKHNNNTSFSAYNPQKYFSSQIEQALKSKYHKASPIETHSRQPPVRGSPATSKPMTRSISMKESVTLQQQPSIHVYEEPLKQKQVQERERRVQQRIDERKEEKIEQWTEGNAPLMECQICNRKFVQPSYLKHVRVCEKVFFKKRPVFKSGSREKRGNSSNR